MSTGQTPEDVIASRTTDLAYLELRDYWYMRRRALLQEVRWIERKLQIETEEMRLRAEVKRLEQLTRK